jgi:hypothetical protein
MRYYFLVTVVTVVFVTAVCPALTIFQTWEVNDWTKVVQPDNVINVQPNGYSYVSVSPIHRNPLAGFSGLYKSIGTTLIPAWTFGGDVPECWIQYDCRYDGEGSQYNCFVGLYNTNGSNDTSSSVEWIGVQNGGQNLQAVSKNTAVFVTAPGMPNTDLNVIERVKMHIYTYDSNTVMDVNVYIYDPNTDTASLAYTVSKYVVLKSSQYFSNDIDAFGIRNTRATFAASTVGNHSLDNMYFSTDGPKTDATPAPSFAAVCNRKTGDYNSDCDVDFKDLAVMSYEWLQTGMVPERVFQWQQE